MSDRPNGIPDLCSLIASTGVTIKDLSQDRAWVTSDVHSVEVRVWGAASGFSRGEISGDGGLRNQRPRPRQAAAGCAEHQLQECEVYGQQIAVLLHHRRQEDLIK